MPIAILTCIFAGAALGSVYAPPQGIAFTRTYKADEKLIYHGVIKMSGMDMTLDTLVKESVVKKAPTAKPSVTLVSTKYESTGKDSTPSEKPRDIVVTIGAHNLPEDLYVKKGDSSFYPWLLIAAMTAEKSVEVGQDIPVSWNGKGDIPLGIEGKGKLTAVDPVAKTATVTWSFTLSFGGQNAGDCAFKSVYDTTDFSLKSSAGTVMNGMYSIHITREISAHAGPSGI